MTVQVLITTMNLKDPEELLNTLNIHSSFVVGNQTDNEQTASFLYRGFTGVIISKNERGVGNNRNITLKYSDSDICILSDDDMRFVDDYSEIVQKTFEMIPKADAVVFNLGNSGNKRRRNTRIKKLNKYNYMNYGAARMAFRRKAVSYNGIFFNSNFGGGTQHSAGEDVLFVGDCIKKGLNVYAVPETIASLLESRESTWFTGYNKKYLFDKGVFLGIADPTLSKLIALYLAIRHPEYRSGNSDLFTVYNEICNGIDYIKKREYLKNEDKN